MKALKLLIVAVIVAGTAPWMRAQPALPLTGTNSDYTVTVHHNGDIPVSKTVAQKIESDVLEMVKSANYISGMPHKGVWQHPEPVSRITRHYRELVANGKYVLVVWAQPQKLQTVLGEITTVETIVELERPGVWMCSVDDEGRMVHLGKFRGDVLARIEKLVKQLAK